MKYRLFREFYVRDLWKRPIVVLRKAAHTAKFSAD
jgi:hypothetical protein